MVQVTKRNSTRRNRSFRSASLNMLAPTMESLEQRWFLSAQPIQVDTFADVIDADDSMTSLREAIDAAALREGDDVIQLANGEYFLDGEELVINDSSGKLTIEAPERAVLDARGASRVINVLESNHVELNNLTITGGAANVGAGIRVTDSNVTIDNAVLHSNTATLAGGGIELWKGSNVTVNNSTVRDNSAIISGGIAMKGGTDAGERLIINDSRIVENTATNAAGLGIGSNGILNNTVVSNNSASGLGGGMGMSEGATVVLIGTTISNNTAGLAGGGIIGGNRDKGPAINSIELNNSHVTGNVAPTGGGIGLGHGVNSLVLNDSSVTENRATTQDQWGGSGGGIFMDPEGNNSAELHGSEVYGNSAVGSGGGIQMSGTVTVGVDTQIFNNESGDLTGDSSSSVHVDKGAVLSADALGESLSAARTVTIEGTLLSTVDSGTKPLKATSTLKFAPGSVLQMEAIDNLGSPGEHKLQIAESRMIRGSFDTTPEIGDHLGSGVFVAEHGNTGSTVEYTNDQVSVNLFQATAGDANGDASIDFEDFLKLSANFGKGQASWVDGDFDGDGQVAFADFLMLADNFGVSEPQADVEHVVTAAAADAALVQLL